MALALPSRVVFVSRQSAFKREHVLHCIALRWHCRPVLSLSAGTGVVCMCLQGKQFCIPGICAYDCYPTPHVFGVSSMAVAGEIL
jgi:hypothetical protein